MFYDGVFDNLDGMKHIKPVPHEMLMDYVPDVAAFKELDFKGADTYICAVRCGRASLLSVEADQLRRVSSSGRSSFTCLSMRRSKRSPPQRCGVCYIWRNRSC